MEKILALRQERAKRIHDARALVDAAEKENRGLTSEEEQRYNQMLQDAADLQVRYERLERQRALDAEITASQGTQAGGQDQPGSEDRSEKKDHEQRAAFNRFIRGGISGLTQVEARALQAGQDDLGGYIVPPQQFVNELIMAVDDEVFIRQKARKFQVVEAKSMGVPALGTDVSDADWTSELATGSEDSSMKFAKRELEPHPLAKLIKVSNKLLASGVMDPEGLVKGRLAYKFGVSEEKAFLTGNGVDKPLGLFVASAMGISTGRDVSDGNAATSIAFDGLINAKYALKAQYLRKAEWLFHRDAIKQIAKLQDGNGNYVWRESVRAGEPDMLLGLPFNMSEFAPNTFQASQYVGIIGDFSFYWIVDALNMQLQRLVELYAASNQVGFIGRAEVDGMPVLEEAFARIKLAAQ